MKAQRVGLYWVTAEDAVRPYLANERLRRKGPSGAPGKVRQIRFDYSCARDVALYQAPSLGQSRRVRQQANDVARSRVSQYTDTSASNELDLHHG